MFRDRADARDALAAAADVVICPLVPERYCGAGAYYADFTPPSDDDVRLLLSRRARRPSQPAGAPRTSRGLSA